MDENVKVDEFTPHGTIPDLSSDMLLKVFAFVKYVFVERLQVLAFMRIVCFDVRVFQDRREICGFQFWFESLQSKL